jgi:hypothetical protein
MTVLSWDPLVVGVEDIVVMASRRRKKNLEGRGIELEGFRDDSCFEGETRGHYSLG